MPLFGFRKDKKYDKDFNLEKSAKADPKKAIKTAKIVKAVKPVSSKAVSVPENKTIKSVPSGMFSSSASTIIRPHITEKSGLLSQNGAYTFQVDKDANKNTVAKAIKELYKVSPRKISIIKVPAKNIFVRGKKGTVAGMKKAVVILKKGDKIDFV